MARTDAPLHRPATNPSIKVYCRFLPPRSPPPSHLLSTGGVATPTYSVSWNWGASVSGELRQRDFFLKKILV